MGLSLWVDFLLVVQQTLARVVSSDFLQAAAWMDCFWGRPEVLAAEGVANMRLPFSSERIWVVGLENVYCWVTTWVMTPKRLCLVWVLLGLIWFRGLPPLGCIKEKGFERFSWWLRLPLMLVCLGFRAGPWIWLLACLWLCCSLSENSAYSCEGILCCLLMLFVLNDLIFRDCSFGCP